MLAEGYDIPTPRELSPGVSDLVHRTLPKITLAVAIAMKIRSDPDEVDLVRLAELHGRPLPEPAEIPMFFRALFIHNRPEFR